MKRGRGANGGLRQTRGGKKEGQARMGTEAAGVGESGLPPRRGSLCKLCHTRVTRDSSMGIRSAISFKLILIHDIAAGLFFFFFNLKIAI